MDTKLYDNFNGLYELLQYDFIKILLKNDSHIYGDILRHILVNNKTFPEFCENNKSINVWSNISLVDIIERDLHKYIISCEQLPQNKINNLINKYINKNRLSENQLEEVEPIINYNFVKIKCYNCNRITQMF